MEQKQPTSFNDNEWDAIVDKLNFENARIISRPWAADEDITECVDMMLACGNGSPARLVQNLSDLKRMLCVIREAVAQRGDQTEYARLAVNLWR